MLGSCCVQENPGHDPLQLDGVFLEGGDDAFLAPLGAGDDEMQRQQGFPDPGRAGDDGGRASPVAIDEHVVQRGHA